MGNKVERKETAIHFRNKNDFRNRIARLIQEQDGDEIYLFSFGDEETEAEFDALMNAFNKELFHGM